MKVILPPEPHSKINQTSSRPRRRLFSTCLTIIGFALVALSAQASILTPPIVGWIPDQRLTSSTPGFQTQYFRMQNFAGATSSNFHAAKKNTSAPGWSSGLTITFAQCQTGDGCPLDGTWWKVMFTGTPATSGSAVITVAATGTNGSVGYTSFTLQVDKAAGATNPPSLATLPNYAGQIDQNNHFVYTAQFPISDLANDNTQDLDEIYAHYVAQDPNPFTFTSRHVGGRRGWDL